MIVEIKNRYDIIVIIKTLLALIIVFFLGGTTAYYLINGFNMKLVASSNSTVGFLNSIIVLSYLAFGVVVLPWIGYRFYKMKKEGTVYNPSTLLLYTNGMFLQFNPKVNDFFRWDEIISMNPVDKTFGLIFRNYIFYDFKFNSKWNLSMEGLTRTYNKNGDKLRMMVRKSEFEAIIKTMNEYNLDVDERR